MNTIHRESEPVEENTEILDDRPWDDIVFENRNQDYGAYVLRKDYSGNILFAFVMTLLLTILLIVCI